MNRVGTPQKTTAVEHRATGNTNGSAPRSHIEAVRKRRALSGQSVERRCLDLVVSESMYRFVALVIGKDEQNVRLPLYCRDQSRATERKEE